MLVTLENIKLCIKELIEEDSRATVREIGYTTEIVVTQVNQIIHCHL